MTVRQEGEELVRTLRAGDLVIIPKGCWHRNEAPEGVTMLHITPREGGPPLLGRSRILETRPILWRLVTTATHVRRDKAALASGCKAHRRPLLPGATGADMEVTKCLKPPDSGHKIR